MSSFTAARSRLRASLTALTALTACLAATGTARATSLPNETEWADGTNWTYQRDFMGFPDAWVYVPDGFTPRAPGRHGLVFHLLGCGQMAFQVAQSSGWPEAAEAYGLIIVVPGIISPVHPNRDAPNVECLNYGYDGAYGVYNPTRNDADHAAIIAAAGDLAAGREHADWQIDPNQVYVAGLSAGGAVADQVACMAPDVFAGVATSAAPGMGSAQGTAVMPPAAGYGANTIAQLCRQYAVGSPNDNAPAKLLEQVRVLASDDNGLRAGNGGLDTSLFNNQQVWDGDKFCPHAYQDFKAQAFTQILGLAAVPTEAGLEVGRGRGIGCAGGENSRGDAGEVQCVIADQIERDWVARADVWTDAQGHTKLVQIQQDTLRHAWPAGPVSALDHEATPSRAELRATGYLNEDTGEFNRDRMAQAPNGQYGVIYMSITAMDYPMFLAETWNNNNPRLGPPVRGDQPAEPEPVEPGPGEEPEPVEPAPPAAAPPTVTMGAATGGSSGSDCLRASGTVAAGDEAVAGVNAVVLGLGAHPTTVDGTAWQFELCGLAPGHYNVLAVAVDASGLESEPTAATRVEIAAAAGMPGGAVESADGTLTDHSNALRVIRFTEQYFALRDAYCTMNGVLWECESFTLYRCEGDAAWATEMPDCGGGAPAVPLAQVAIGLTATAEPAEQTAGGEIAISVTMENTGPDAASAVYSAVDLPAGLEHAGGDERCVAFGRLLVCHLQGLAAGASGNATLRLRATAPGAPTLDLRGDSAQSASEAHASVALNILAGAASPDAGAGPGEQPSAGGAGGDDGPSGSGGEIAGPESDAGLPGADAAGMVTAATGGPSEPAADPKFSTRDGGCAAAGRPATVPPALLLPIVLGLIASRRRRK